MNILKEITDTNAKCRCENAIYFLNGKVVLFDGDLYKGYKISGIKNIKDEENDINWGILYFMYSDKSKDYLVYAGETGHGGAGFIALKRLNSNIFEWVLHLNNCNNFISVAFDGDNIIAKSDEPYPEGSKFIVPIDNPDKFEVNNKNIRN